MHKLVILIDPLFDEEAFDDLWPQFLRLSERMPGLRREASCRVERNLYGQCQAARIHELYFDSERDIEAAMASPEGRGAGELLQRMTGGAMTLLIADHKEDELDNIRQYQPEAPEHD